ncbi:sensor histidine kinase [Kribbella ginsengisoli]|uniref:histidine kinase n=1 Tax=Kribbella ginsengisoli TaxID=363865 RepID=A0ABP6YJ78_9ACTN
MRLSWWEGKRWVVAFDILVAAGLTILPFLEDKGPAVKVTGVLVSVVVFGGFVVRRRLPLVAVAVTPVGLAFPSLQIMVAAYTVASRKGLRWQALVSAAYCSVVVVVWPVPRRDAYSWPEALASCVLFVGAPMLLGLWVYQRRALLQALRDRADQAERERDLRAESVVIAERRRIAREMHDVVAHRVSAIALQSGALTMTAPDEHTEQVAEVIRRTSTTALTELREILQVLRDEQPGEPGHVAPALSAVPVLVDDARATGLDVHLELPDPVPDPAPAAGRAAYRVVQEALTNAAKHAPGQPVSVVITTDADDLTVEITNPRAGTNHPHPRGTAETPDGRGVGDTAGGRRGVEAEVPGAGFGLVGMRERVSLAGGVLEVGWVAERFRVRVVLPMKVAD